MSHCLLHLFSRRCQGRRKIRPLQTWPNQAEETPVFPSAVRFFRLLLHGKDLSRILPIPLCFPNSRSPAHSSSGRLCLFLPKKVHPKTHRRCRARPRGPSSPGAFFSGRPGFLSSSPVHPGKNGLPRAGEGNAAPVAPVFPFFALPISPASRRPPRRGERSTRSNPLGKPPTSPFW